MVKEQSIRHHLWIRNRYS